MGIRWGDHHGTIDRSVRYAYHTYTGVTAMVVEWDAAKAEANARKHGIQFSDARAVPFDPVSLILDEADVDDEARLVMIGSDALGRVVVVILTYRADVVRLISARRATGTERAVYEKGI